MQESFKIKIWLNSLYYAGWHLTILTLLPTITIQGQYFLLTGLSISLGNLFDHLNKYLSKVESHYIPLSNSKNISKWIFTSLFRLKKYKSLTESKFYLNHLQFFNVSTDTSRFWQMYKKIFRQSINTESCCKYSA